ncbi:MAG: hypothetical protein IT355_12090 [Gemmatimonadaceae bacterium]|nr:hypothetical protein [Gemmatimonadaceae bacterium]
MAMSPEEIARGQRQARELPDGRPSVSSYRVIETTVEECRQDPHRRIGLWLARIDPSTGAEEPGQREELWHVDATPAARAVSPADRVTIVFYPLGWPTPTTVLWGPRVLGDNRCCPYELGTPL